jgi:serine/threonine-protein kinase
VVLGNVITPGQYAAGIQRLLDIYPDASYLRTDQSCPSLRQASDDGNPIYTVYRPAGATSGQVCSTVHSVGGDAYGKWLDTTTDPAYILPC